MRLPLDWACAGMPDSNAIPAIIPAVNKRFITRNPGLYFIVGMTNSAPSLTPDGQRAVTVFVLV